jgi:hypothetical protein
MKPRCVLGLAALVALGGCSSETTATTAAPVNPVTSTSATPATTQPPTTLPETTATTASPETTTTVETPTTTTLPTSVCPVPVALAEGTASYPGVAADFDGDGAADELLTYQAGPDEWRVRVIFADGGGADAAIVDAEDFVPPRPIGGFDIDEDGTAEAFVLVGSGASTALMGFFEIEDCVATRITADGVPAVFGVGGSVGSISGISCPGDGTIHRNFARYVEEDVYEGGFEPFTLEGSVLTAGTGDGATLTAEEAYAVGSLDCGDLLL